MEVENNNRAVVFRDDDNNYHVHAVRSAQRADRVLTEQFINHIYELMRNGNRVTHAEVDVEKGTAVINTESGHVYGSVTEVEIEDEN